MWGLRDDSGWTEPGVPDRVATGSVRQLISRFGESGWSGGIGELASEEHQTAGLVADQTPEWQIGRDANSGSGGSEPVALAPDAVAFQLRRQFQLEPSSR